jgi:hypothetical protein
MPGEPGQAPPPTAVEVWPSVAPFGEADRISVSIIALAFLCLQLAPLSPAQAATTTRGRPQLRPQDRIRSQTPGSPPARRSQTSAAATLPAVQQCRSSMAGSPGHQLADPDHQQWSPHNAQIRAAGAERGIRGGHRAERRLVARSPCLRLSLRVTFRVHVPRRNPGPIGGAVSWQPQTGTLIDLAARPPGTTSPPFQCTICGRCGCACSGEPGGSNTDLDRSSG